MNIPTSNIYEIVREHNYVPVDVYRFENPKLLWINQSQDINRSEFLEKYAIGIPGNSCFAKVQFSENSKRVAEADRYGGYGGASNGGGSRCANFLNAQIKGVGTNKLLGKSVINSWYAHGSLNIVDAVCEVIYSDVLNRIMPHGVVQSLGLILISDSSGYYGENVANVENAVSCRGTLIVRDECVRPAHFLRARNYIPLDEWKHDLIHDVNRVRNINKSLSRLFPSHFKFIEFISHVFTVHADQFAFAKVARIIHGSATSSNLTIDGKWIDFAATSFLPAGKNYQTGVSGPAFFDEHANIEDILIEFCDTYTKFNGFDLNLDPLITYYRNAMSAYFHKHCAFVLGIQPSDWPEIGTNQDADIISSALHDLIHQDSTPIITSPYRFQIEDPILLFLFGLYGSFFGKAEALAYHEKLFGSSERAGGLSAAFSRFINNLNNTNPGSHRNNASLIAAHRSIKRLFCSAFFFRGRLRHILAENLYCENDAFFEDFVESSILVSKFAFQETDEITVLFSNNELKIYFLNKPEEYVVSEERADEIRFSTYKQLLVYIDKKLKSDLIINEFNFYDLFNLLNIVVP